MIKHIVLIDGANMSFAMNAIGRRFDWKKLRHFFVEADYGLCLGLRYYTAIHERADGEQPLRKIVDWLSYNGYLVVSKMTKSYENSDGSTRIKGNMDIEMATDMIRFAPRVDKIHLFTGDADFTYAVKAVQDMGVIVDVYSTMQGANSIIGDDLRRQANNYIDIGDLPIPLFMADRNG